jgi:serine/threonine protein kinase
MTLPTGSTLGPYQILNILGTGGMGEVYRARDSRLGREVAIKVLLETARDSPEAVARFEREARAVASLSHPAVLTLHDVGHEGPLRYVVTELLEGETLRTWLSRERPTWQKAVDICVSVAEGLAAAHAIGIVHRDLKPENIFLTSDGRVKILDFVAAAEALGASIAELLKSPGYRACHLVTLEEAAVLVGPRPRRHTNSGECYFIAADDSLQLVVSTRPGPAYESEEQRVRRARAEQGATIQDEPSLPKGSYSSRQKDRFNFRVLGKLAIVQLELLSDPEKTVPAPLFEKLRDLVRKAASRSN